MGWLTLGAKKGPLSESLKGKRGIKGVSRSEKVGSGGAGRGVPTFSLGIEGSASAGESSGLEKVKPLGIEYPKPSFWWEKKKKTREKAGGRNGRGGQGKGKQKTRTPFGCPPNQNGTAGKSREGGKDLPGAEH